MSNPSHAPSRIQKRKRGPKLTTLPKDASTSVSKRPLLRPALPSPYSGAQNQKTIYVGKNTPFMSAVKRAEKLLHLSDKRLVQSATQLAKDASWRNRKRGRGEDEILEIAREVEEQKKNGTNAKRRKTGHERGVDVETEAAMEEVVLKGTGKAISKVMELGLWFQQREEYVVRLKTGTVGAVDDVTYQEDEGDGHAEAEAGAEAVATGAQKGDHMDVDAADETDVKLKKVSSRVVKREVVDGENGRKEVTETRIRNVSVLEAYVSLR